MQRHYILILLCLSISIQLRSQTQEVDWLTQMRIKQIENIQNSNLWDLKRQEKDIKPINELLPIRFGAFPVPVYDSLMRRSYRGGGVESSHLLPSVPEYRLQVDGKEVMYCSFFIGNSPFHRCEGEDDVFFTIITLVDTLTAENYAIGTSQFLSRNHPDLGGQGSFYTKNNKIEFVAFATPDKEDFAIVNMRLFHLEYGNIIIIAPQKNGSFKSMQIKGKKRDSEGNYDYIKNDLLKQEQIIEFLTAEDVI